MISSRRLTLFVVSLAIALFAANGAFAQCTTPFASQPSPPGGDQIYIDDAIPGYASVSSGTLSFDTGQYATGSQSFVLSGSGTQTVEISDLAEFYKFGSGKAVLYVLIDPCDTTAEIKVTYESAYRKAAVYWGSNSIGGEPGIIQFNRGSLPSTGTWTRLEIPISSPLALRGHTVVKQKFQIYGGRVWFDHVGTDGVGCTPTTASAPSIPSGGTVWLDDSIPSGAYMSAGEAWTSQAASGSVSYAYPYFGQTATGVVRVNDLNQATASGDNLFLYVMPTGCETLKELKISWFSGSTYSTAGCIYYGSTTPAPAIGGESSCTFMGSTLPPNDTWTRIEIPASTVGMDGATITSFMVANIGSQVWVDYVGNVTP
jgi:hypothetical protein